MSTSASTSSPGICNSTESTVFSRVSMIVMSSLKTSSWRAKATWSSKTSTISSTTVQSSILTLIYQSNSLIWRTRQIQCPRDLWLVLLRTWREYQWIALAISTWLPQDVYITSSLTLISFIGSASKPRRISTRYPRVCYRASVPLLVSHKVSRYSITLLPIPRWSTLSKMLCKQLLRMEVTMLVSTSYLSFSFIAIQCLISLVRKLPLSISPWISRALLPLN